MKSSLALPARIGGSLKCLSVELPAVTLLVICLVGGVFGEHVTSSRRVARLIQVIEGMSEPAEKQGALVISGPSSDGNGALECAFNAGLQPNYIRMIELMNRYPVLPLKTLE